MKILGIQPFLKGYTVFPTAGGKDKAALEISRAVRAAGHDLDILPLPWGLESRNNELVANPQPVLLGDEALQARMLPTLTIPDRHEARSMLWQFLTSKRSFRHPYASARDIVWRGFVDKKRSITRAVTAEKYDLMLVHQTGSDAILTARAAGFRGRAVLVHHSAGLSAFVSRYDHVVFVSAAQQAAALQRYPQLQGRSSVIYYFADRDYFRPTEPAARAEATFIGLLDDTRKGLDLLLQAYIETPALRAVKLNVIGDGKLRPRFEEQVRQHGLPVQFHGRISHEANAEILARSGAFVMPSRAEGLALTYLEALCMGVPIVGFTPNVREIEAVLGRTVGHAFHADGEPVARLAEHVLSLTLSETLFSTRDRADLAARTRARFSLPAFHRSYTEFVRNLEPGNS